MTRARYALVLAIGLLALADCGGSSRAEVERSASRARALMNAYCQARQAALDALGIDGSAAVGLGDAGASQ